MKHLVLSVSIEDGNKRVEAVNTTGDDAYMQFVAKVEDFNKRKINGRTWEILEGVDPKITDYFFQEQERDRETRTRERDDIKDYFRSAITAIENLESIWEEKF